MQLHSKLATFPAQKRKGMSRVEWLVLIVLIGVLLAILGPALFFTRQENRVLICQQNLSEYSKAVGLFEEHNRALPYLSDDVGQSWIRQLMPFLELGGIYESLETGEKKPSEISLKVLACPADETASGIQGQTSYVGNVGYIGSSLWSEEDLSDLESTHSPDNLKIYNWAPTEETDADPEISSATGIFVRPSSASRITLASIQERDGVSFTILITENVQATNWWGQRVAECGFGANLSIDGFAKSTTPEAPLALTPETLTHFNQIGIPSQAFDQAQEGQVPRPSSFHTEGVNVLYADGRVKPMDESIAPLVYYSLMTSNGVLYGQSQLDEDAF